MVLFVFFFSLLFFILHFHFFIGHLKMPPPLDLWRKKMFFFFCFSDGNQIVNQIAGVGLFSSFAYNYRHFKFLSALVMKHKNYDKIQQKKIIKKKKKERNIEPEFNLQLDYWRENKIQKVNAMNPKIKLKINQILQKKKIKKF